MIDQKKKRRMSGSGMKFLAVSVLSAALLAGQAQPTMVRGGSVIEASSLIPDNVTIDKPVALSEISLPKSEYGKLAWADDSCVPTRRVESFEVVFTPNGTADLSGVSGWDSEKEKIYGYVTVIVSSLEDKEEEGASEDVQGQESVDEGCSESEVSGEIAAPAGEETSENPDMTEALPAADTPEGETTPEVTEVPAEGADVPENPDTTEVPSITEAPEGEITPEVTEGPAEGSDAPEIPDAAETPSTAGTPEGEVPPEMTENPDAPEITDAPQITDDPEAIDTPDVTGTPEITDNPDNIFDKVDETPEEDNRPIIVGSEVTPEEQEQLAQTNHCSNGIYVSGINLPWYVQFRATTGEGYEFSNEKEAGIFKSYEFELWDLRDNTEYKVPDGEYISVTLPVKAGYNYTVEHLLDNGAKETIIPSVNGTTMVFSTHSFSPFGIAGSKPIVGGEIIDEGYKPITVTPTPTNTPAVTKKPTPVVTKRPVATKAPTVTQKPAGTVSSGNNSQGGSGQNSSGSSNGNSSYNNSTGNTTSNNNSTSNSTNQNSGNQKYVNTGDTTQILPFVILVAAAAIVVVVVMYLKKRK